MEVVWYLRFSRVPQVEVLFDRQALGQVENTLHLEPNWKLTLSEVDDALLGTFRKNIPQK